MVSGSVYLTVNNTIVREHAHLRSHSFRDVNLYIKNYTSNTLPCGTPESKPAYCEVLCQQIVDCQKTEMHGFYADISHVKFCRMPY